MNNHNDMKL